MQCNWQNAPFALLTEYNNVPFFVVHPFLKYKPWILKLIHAIVMIMMIMESLYVLCWFLRNVTHFTYTDTAHSINVIKIQTEAQYNCVLNGENRERVNCTWIGVSRGGNLFWMGKWIHHWIMCMDGSMYSRMEKLKVFCCCAVVWVVLKHNNII